MTTRNLILVCWTTLIGLLLMGASAADTSPRLDRFESSIRAFEGQDRLTPPPAGGTVFVGSSSVVRWVGLEKDFADYHAINRGFGGSTIPEINFYSDRIVVCYRPRRIVFYAGTNDIAEGHDGSRVCADFRQFVGHVRKALPNVHIYFISMSMPPSRVQWRREYDVGNRCIQNFIARTHGLRFIDVTRAMTDGSGNPRAELFGPDALHMTPMGYALWTPMVRKALQDEEKDERATSHGE